MRICLFWNESAGEGVSLDELRALIADAGHRVARVVDDVTDLAALAAAPPDCVVAAGGDGTVARAGRALAGGPVPLAILPLGTANNIASSLAIEGDLRDLIARWSRDRIVTIDVGVVHDDLGESYFLESVGAGLVAEGIAEGTATLSKDDPAAHLREARRMYLDAIAHLRPRRRGLTIDGEELDGDYLLIEVLNTPSIGPGIRLSPDVSAADGLLSVVAAGEADRDALTAYMHARLNGEPDDAGLTSWRASRVVLADVTGLHVDDKSREASTSVSIGIKPGSLRVMA